MKVTNMAMTHHRSFTGNDVSHQFSTRFSSVEGYRILSNVISDEYKLLEETKRILEKRLVIDEQYARNLQELTASADGVAWPVNTHPIASASREVFLQWSHLATKISSSVEQFRRTIVDELIKELIEQKKDSKKFLDDEKRGYDLEHRKALNELMSTEKRYSEEAKAYAVKNTDLTKLQSSRKCDETRVKQIEESLKNKGANVYRAHNEYLIKLREYNFTDQIYLYKIRTLLDYHESIECLLNRAWQNLLESIANYPNSQRMELLDTMESLHRTVMNADPRHCYDELCKVHSNISPISKSFQSFNDLLRQASGLSRLKSDKFIVVDSTKQEIKQKIDKLTNSINEPIPKLGDLINNRSMTYTTRKALFEHEQLVEYFQKKKKFDEDLREELKAAFNDVGYLPDDRFSSDSDDDEHELTDRLEDQPYFHGVLPRPQSIGQLTERGDYLVRINEQGKLVLSVLLTDAENPMKLKDYHYIINESNQMYSINLNAVSKSTVNDLIAFYKRQKLDLRESGTRLIRPITRPDYMINNEEIRTLETLGKGHFGQVARAEYRGHFVAVKILHASSADRTTRDRQNFINEALLLRQYKHKNIVKFLGIAAMRDPLMIVMELVEEGSLNNYLRKNELRVSQLIQMCYDIAKGMEYLEKHNVIHRDLAARNCLIDRKIRVKVADFGLSRCLQSDEEYFCQIKEVPVRWWAVEVFSSSPYTSKSDVWSYGITAWEVFSRADTPYSHIIQNHQVIDAVKHGERLKQPEKCPTKIFNIMMACWALQPKDRPNFEKLVEQIKKEKPLF